MVQVNRPSYLTFHYSNLSLASPSITSTLGHKIKAFKIFIGCFLNVLYTLNLSSVFEGANCSERKLFKTHKIPKQFSSESLPIKDSTTKYLLTSSKKEFSEKTCRMFPDS